MQINIKYFRIIPLFSHGCIFFRITPHPPGLILMNLGVKVKNVISKDKVFLFILVFFYPKNHIFVSLKNHLFSLKDHLFSLKTNSFKFSLKTRLFSLKDHLFSLKDLIFPEKSFIFPEKIHFFPPEK